ncbi:MAG: hypothetical protein ACXVNF_03130 [Neobacillus sp.]
MTSSLVERQIAAPDNVISVICTDQAKNLLIDGYFDVMILDVVLPKRGGETPNFNHGISFLEQISRSPRLNKPEKIIGLTAQLQDIHKFKAEFEKFCLTVIEAKATTAGWKDRVIDSLTYTMSSKLARITQQQHLHLLTVHGIRTFGDWQNRLQKLISSRVSGIEFSSYKYGYFSAFAFLIPFLREIETRRLTGHLRSTFARNPNQSFVVYCHSFGTFQVAHSLQKLVSEGQHVPVKLLVLSGSVLPSNFDWTFLHLASGTRVINECTDRDYVLWLSEALVIGTGMAGKSGFLGMQTKNLVNRYFKGGHSSYFNNDFMEKYWLPLLNLDEDVELIDERRVSPLMHGFFEKLIMGVGKIKKALYVLAALILVLLFL